MLGWVIKKQGFLALEHIKNKKILRLNLRFFIEFYCELENTTLIKKQSVILHQLRSLFE